MMYALFWTLDLYGMLNVIFSPGDVGILRCGIPLMTFEDREAEGRRGSGETVHFVEEEPEDTWRGTSRAWCGPSCRNLFTRKPRFVRV